MIEAKKINSPAFLSGGGEMGERTRNFDWKNTTLGVPENWPPALQNLLSLMLANRFPMILWWGSDYIQFYNDAYIPISGLKHPDNVLGKQAKDCWQEIWHVIGPLIDTPYNGGEPTWMDNILLQLHRKNFTEETLFYRSIQPRAR